MWTAFNTAGIVKENIITTDTYWNKCLKEFENELTHLKINTPS